MLYPSKKTYLRKCSQVISWSPMPTRRQHLDLTLRVILGIVKGLKKILDDGFIHRYDFVNQKLSIHSKNCCKIIPCTLNDRRYVRRKLSFAAHFLLSFSVHGIILQQLFAYELLILGLQCVRVFVDYSKYVVAD